MQLGGSRAGWLDPPVLGISWDGMKASPPRNGAEHGSGSIDASEVIVPRTARLLGDDAGEEKVPKGVPELGNDLAVVCPCPLFVVVDVNLWSEGSVQSASPILKISSRSARLARAIMRMIVLCCIVLRKAEGRMWSRCKIEDDQLGYGCM
jgi:hypothetical protein